MKKRIFSLVMAITIFSGVLLFSSCGLGARIENAVERTEDLDSYEATVELSSTVNKLTSSIKYEIEQKDSDIGNEKGHYKINNNGMTAEVYRNGDWVYIPTSTGGFKMSLRNYQNGGYDLEDIEDIVSDIVVELPDGIVGDAVTKKHDETYTLTATLTQRELEDDYEDIVARLRVFAGISKNDTSLKLLNPTINIVVEDGYVESYEISIDMETASGFTKLVHHTVARVTFDDPGDGVDIDFPKGYEKYEETKGFPQ